MISISKTSTGILVQRDDLDIEIHDSAVKSGALGIVIVAMIDTGRSLGAARKAGYEAGLQAGYAQCEREREMSARIAARQETDLADALLISGLAQAA